MNRAGVPAKSGRAPPHQDASRPSSPRLNPSPIELRKVLQITRCRSSYRRFQLARCLRRRAHSFPVRLTVASANGRRHSAQRGLVGRVAGLPLCAFGLPAPATSVASLSNPVSIRAVSRSVELPPAAPPCDPLPVSRGARPSRSLPLASRRRVLAGVALSLSAAGATSSEHAASDGAETPFARSELHTCRS